MLAGCEKEPPARTVTEFVENPILLEAAMVRCSQDRAKTRYDAECVNARQAVARVQAKEEAAERAELEARSERKMKAFRRTREAAAEAQRQSDEERRLRQEAEYLAQFGVEPTGAEEVTDPLSEGNLPVAVVPEVAEEAEVDGADAELESATDGDNAPIPDAAPEPPASDLESIREELRRRSEEVGD